MSIALTLFAFVVFGQQMPDQKALMNKNNDLVIQWVGKAVGQSAGMLTTIPVADQGIPELLNGSTFHSVHCREFPMAMRAPEPFATRNVVLVSATGTMTHFSERKKLVKFFLESFKGVPVDSVEKISMAWIKVSTVFDQDGFFEFVFDAKNITGHKSESRTTIVAEAPVVEKGGDTGKLVSTLTFSLNQETRKFKLESIEEKNTIQPGIRPVCQCTLLLDHNPIVRKMAERDLLVMGKHAFSYMREQLEMASPELKIEIQRVWKRIERGER